MGQTKQQRAETRAVEHEIEVVRAQNRGESAPPPRLEPDALRGAAEVLRGAGYDAIASRLDDEAEGPRGVESDIAAIRRRRPRRAA